MVQKISQLVVASVLILTLVHPALAVDEAPVTVYPADLRALARYSSRDTFHATTQFPRRALYYLASSLSDADAAMIARWDYAVLALENQYTSPSQLRQIKTLNPNIRLAFYFPINEANLAALEPPTGALHELAPDLDRNLDFLKKPDGSDVSFWPDAVTYDLTKKNVRAVMIRFLKTVPDQTIWNDAFLDNVWSRVADTPWVQGGVDQNRNGVADDPAKFNRLWIQSSIYFMRDLRRVLPTSMSIVANMSEKNFAYGFLNGRMFEGFPNTLPTEKLIRQNYVSTAWRRPRTVIVHGEGNIDQVDRWTRVTTFTLMADGFVAYDHGPVPNDGPNDTGRHDVRWWNDELYRSIGQALGPSRFYVQSKTYIREFSGAVVIHNPDPVAKTIEVIKRDKTRVRVTVPPQNGLIVRW